MKPLSIGVAIAAAIALVAGITQGGVDVLGFAADPTLLSVGAVGLMLALTTFRSPLISPFLRVFSTIFAVEYVVTGLAYVAVQAGWWPPSFMESAPPASIPNTVAIFGLLVHLISFIPVIRQITRLADPYFMTNDRGDLQIGGFGAPRDRTAICQFARRYTCRNQPASGCHQRSTRLLQSGLVQRDSKQGLRRVLVAAVRGVLLLGGDRGRQQPG